MEIIIKGRNVEVPEHFRDLVEEKLESKIAKYNRKSTHVDVELYHEPNPRQHDHAQRVEITCHSKGPVIRAEASDADFRTAFELACNKLSNRLRRAADRRRSRGSRTAAEVLDAPPLPPLEAEHKPPKPTSAGRFISEDIDPFEDLVEDHEPGHIVREKSHSGEPMTVDDALHNMELVGHDFYLFHDKESGRPSVVYRRHAFDYGILRLEM
ncbi:ribosome hibernation-promoting factor, HPF/YfiA family [Natronoglycomyces albus]|uniref:Ribosome hibernation promoting factor n=1 Tax=Natronoglycomyces albus TaxID=2811108 RepID=A0A895XSW5_9ACTN|nr:ribosome-associated translation inhibitor RaiA [Natronoglycomyces albus]QSB04728.1 ribosome-associated translation inhibitor RaiA [Natronoglycomyces albus]